MQSFAEMKEVGGAKARGLDRTRPSHLFPFPLSSNHEPHVTERDTYSGRKGRKEHLFEVTIAWMGCRL